ncbi:MAG: hypothetical protein ACC662_06180, partial [Planctomycetota bacterium]
LVDLAAASFGGRHYDECGMPSDYLMRDGMPGSREAVLASLRDLLRGAADERLLPSRLGASWEVIERRWLESP